MGIRGTQFKLYEVAAAIRKQWQFSTSAGAWCTQHTVSQSPGWAYPPNQPGACGGRPLLRGRPPAQSYGSEPPHGAIPAMVGHIATRSARAARRRSSSRPIRAHAATRTGSATRRQLDVSAALSNGSYARVGLHRLPPLDAGHRRVPYIWRRLIREVQ